MKSSRRFITFVFTLLTYVFFILPSSQAQETPANNWSQFRGNHSLNGASASRVAARPRLLWTYEAGDAIESSAAVVGGTVYVGSQKGELASINLENGSVYWKYSTRSPIGESSPAWSDYTVYIGDLGGVLHAVAAPDGRARWTFKTGGEIKSSPVVVGDRVLIGSYDQFLYCLSTSNGSVLWKVKTEGPVHATPAVQDGVVFIAGCDEVFRAIRLSDGKQIYQVASGAYTGASPALRGAAAYYGTFNNEVLMVSLNERRVGWRYRDPQRQFPFYSSAAVVDGHVVVGGRDKTVHCLDGDGNKKWAFTTRARVESSPAIAGGRVFIGSNDGRFYVLNLQTGAKVWEFNAGAAISASPGIANGRVVVGASDGRLYCFG